PLKRLCINTRAVGASRPLFAGIALWPLFTLLSSWPLFALRPLWPLSAGFGEQRPVIRPILTDAGFVPRRGGVRGVTTITRFRITVLNGVIYRVLVPCAPIAQPVHRTAGETLRPGIAARGQRVPVRRVRRLVIGCGGDTNIRRAVVAHAVVRGVLCLGIPR